MITGSILGSAVTSFGLFCDICGALLIAWEAFRKYDGDRYQSAAGLTVKADKIVEQSDVQPTVDFKEWEARREKFMKIGLGMLCFGLVMQIVGVWI